MFMQEKAYIYGVFLSQNVQSTLSSLFYILHTLATATRHSFTCSPHILLIFALPHSFILQTSPISQDESSVPLLCASGLSDCGVPDSYDEGEDEDCCPFLLKSLLVQEVTD